MPIGIIHDYRPPCLGGSGETASALLLPLAGRYVINRIVDALSAVGCRELYVVPSFEGDDDYAERLSAAAAHARLSVIGGAARDRFPVMSGPNDPLIVVDPRHFPVYGYDFKRLLDVYDDSQCAVFAHAMTTGESPAECIALDSEGNVNDVFFNVAEKRGLPPTCVATPYGVLSIEHERAGLRFPLSAMRQRLAQLHVPLCDVQLESPVAYLNRREDILQLCGDSASNLQSDDCIGLAPYGCSETAWVEGNARVAESARLIGDVIVNADARIEERATLVGPVVVGRGATVGADTTVAHSIILDRALVQPGATVHRDVVVGIQRAARWDVGLITRVPSTRLCEASYDVLVDDCSGNRQDTERPQCALIKRVVDFLGSAVGLAAHR